MQTDLHHSPMFASASALLLDRLWSPVMPFFSRLSGRFVAALLLLGCAPWAMAQNIAIGNATVTEGDAGTQVMSFPVTITPPAGGPITLTVDTSNGSATAGSDYAGITAGSANIPAGAGTFGLEVTILNDTTVEPSQTFTVAISNPSAGNIVTGQALGTIIDNDAAVLNLTSVSQPEGNAGNTAMSFAATLSQPVEGTVTASFATSDASAQVSDADYLTSNGTLSFASGVTSQSITVQIVGDSTVENDESFALTLSNLTQPPGITTVSLGANASVLGTIENDDSSTLTLSGASVFEGDVGTTVLNFTLSASNSSAIPLGVTASTSDGTAIAPGDYTALPGQAVVVPAGVDGRSVSIAVVVNGDFVPETDESFTLSLSAPSAGASISGPATGTILNDDDTIAISIGDVRQTEGTGAGTTAFRFPVTLSSPAAVPLTVDFSTINGTATAPADYLATTGTLVLPAGSLNGEIVVQVVADNLIEPDETFTVQLTNPTPAQTTLGRATALGSIQSDDFIAVTVNHPRALWLLILLAVGTGILALRRSS
jgi:chitinase